MTVEHTPVNQPGQRVVQLADAPVFIVGCPRSGTTWVQRLLLGHPQVCGGQESHFFTSFAPVFKSIDDRGDERRDVGLRCYWTKEGFIGEIRRLWQLTMKPIIDAAPAATLLIEKTPEHATCIRRIREILPAARFIHVIRDSRAVTASMFAARQHAWGRWAPRNVFKASRKWLECVRLAREAGRPLAPTGYMEVRYEDLHANTINYTRAMLEFCGLPPLDDGRLQELVKSQEFDKQRESGGTPITVSGEAAKAKTGAKSEPTGFFNAGKPDAWRRNLTLPQKVTTYLLTRRTMNQLGYTW
jgi:LPS sulfotransferase NodH